LDLRQLRYFIHIVELESITAASERLAIAQPALSRQIKALELELGIPLLRRHGRGVKPTMEGLKLANRAKRILEDVEEMTRDLTGKGNAPTGTLTLGLTPTVAAMLATHLITKAMKTFPDVNLRIVSGFSGHVQDWLIRGKIDLGVAYEGQIATSIRTKPIILETLYLVRSAKDANADCGAVPLRNALSLPMILPNPDHGLRGRIDHFARQAGVSLDVRLEIDVLPTILSFVESGLGATVLPLGSVIDLVNQGRLVASPISEADVNRSLILMSPLNRPESRLSTVFSDFLIEEIHALVESKDWLGTTL
jgi:LysR family nitrogen assimilation transcriptional regulator